VDEMGSWKDPHFRRFIFLFSLYEAIGDNGIAGIVSTVPNPLVGILSIQDVSASLYILFLPCLLLVRMAGKHYYNDEMKRMLITATAFCPSFSCLTSL
jgi:hypothetical protein